MFPEFPDDNKNEDFLNEFRQKIAEQPTTSFEERKNELNRSKSVFIGALSGVVLAGIVGWFVLSPRYAQEATTELPIIRRPQTAIKVQPTEPGGMEILNQDKSVYGILDKSENNKIVENLLPPPEEPKLPVIAANEPTAIEQPIESEKENDTDVPAADISDIIEEAEKIVQVAETSQNAEVKKEKNVVEEKEEKNVSKEVENKASPSIVKVTEKEVVKTEPQKSTKEEKIMIDSDDFLALTAPSGAWQVQLMSSNNKAAIEKSWNTLSKKYNVLEKQPHEIETADLGAKGIFYRLKAGAFKTKAEADTLCNDIKALGGTCIVKKK